MPDDIITFRSQSVFNAVCAGMGLDSCDAILGGFWRSWHIGSLNRIGHASSRVRQVSSSLEGFERFTAEFPDRAFMESEFFGFHAD